MQQSIASLVDQSLCHLYISPLEQCNLHCKMCYTTKTSNHLTGDEILGFIHRYNQVQKVQTVTFCGGEVFLLSDFIFVVNTLTDEGIFVQIITNGTIDMLEQFHQPNQINLIVSLDGLPEYHDQNRGQNRWQESLEFIKKALKIGFHTEIFSIITKENLPDIDYFETRLINELKQPISVTYHPRKPIEYLRLHPTSNQMGETDGFSFISASERLQLSKQRHIFPPPQLGCYQISLMSDGKVYGCCEGMHPLGSITSNIKDIITAFKSRVSNNKLGCVEPNFACGLKEAKCH